MQPLARLLGVGALALAGCASTTPRDLAPAQRPLGRGSAGGPALGCFGLDRQDELVCRADLRILAARERGDEGVLGCTTRRGSELRATYRGAEAAREAARDPRADPLVRERVALATRNLERQLDLLEACFPAPVRPPDSVTVVVPRLPADET